MNIIEYWKVLIDDCTYPAEYPFQSEWISLGKSSHIKGLGGWETPMIAHEIAHYDLSRAKHLIILYLKSCLREEDGMLAAKVIAKSDPLFSQTEKGRLYKYSHPPVWSFTAKKLLEKKWDENFAIFCFESGKKNLKWWEENRKDRIGLFWYMDSFPDMKNSSESGYELSPRWDFTDLGPFPCIDLNCQILLYMENLAFIARNLKLFKEEQKLISAHEELKKVAMRYFWDEIVGFFCDYDLTGLNAKKTTASFWCLISGLLPEEETDRIISLLKNPYEFQAPMGLPVVSLTESRFELDFWRGCLWASEVFWLCSGLQRYGLNEIATEIAKRNIENIYKIFKDTGKLWEFYNPVDGDMSRLKRKKTSMGPLPDYPGSVPIISLEKIAEGEKVW